MKQERTGCQFGGVNSALGLEGSGVVLFSVVFWSGGFRGGVLSSTSYLLLENGTSVILGGSSEMGESEEGGDRKQIRSTWGFWD